MALSIQTLALAKKYTDDSLVGLGALKGASCTIQDIVKENGMNKITLEERIEMAAIATDANSIFVLI